jgi:hypothetical protein
MQIPDIKTRPVSWLKGNIDRANICKDFDEATLNAIGADVLKWHGIDDESRSEWKEQVEKGIAIAKQVMEAKNTPWQGCANFKDPLMAEAAMNFSSRAMGEVVRGKDVIKNEVVGEDPLGLKEARAKRVSTCMSYQVLTQQPEWYPGTDQLLTSLPLIGMYYKCTYRDTALSRNVSEARSPLEVVVHNDTKTLALADRISWEFKRNRNYILEKIRNGVWSDIEDKLSPDEDCPLQPFIEQQCWYDLDNDGYKEPYLITVHRESGAVARICVCYDEEGIIYGKSGDEEGGQKVLRITALDYYTEFGFLLQPDGTFHKMGFAQLLGAITELINTGFNQLYDSGTIAIRRPGFIGKNGKIPAGGVKSQLGMLTPVDCSGQDLRQSIVFPAFTGPSATMYQVVELLIDRGHKLASISDSMQGETGGANVPATTTLALLDQALKTFTSILWRQYYSFASEYKKLRNLNYQYLTDKEYINIIDISVEDLKKLGIMEHVQVQNGVEVVVPAENTNKLVQYDFDPDNCDIEPVMDPKASSEALRLARLNAMVQAAEMPPVVGRIYLKGIGCSQADIEAIFPSPELGPDGKPVPPPPDPKVVELQAKIQQMQQQGEQKDKELALKHAEVEQKEEVAIWTIMKLKEEIVNIRANSTLALANAEKAEVGTQIEVSRQNLAELQHELDQMNADRDHSFQVMQAQLQAQGGENESGSGTTGSGNDGDSGAEQGEPSAMAQSEGDTADNGVSTGAAAGSASPTLTGTGTDGGQPGGSILGESVGGTGRDGLHPGVSQLAPAGPMQ